MSFRTSRIALGLVAGWALMAPLAHAGGPAPLSGEVLGQVSSSLGVSQMGATVLLFNRYDVLVRQSLSDAQGRFAFDGLAPDLYSIRVSLASFVPAFRRNITVLPGAESLLKINLANVLSTVALIPATSAPGTLMTDDWKWVLRASQATRPALRLLPDSSTSQTRAAASMFSDTSGLVKLSTGDSDSTGGGIADDMGTAFAVATSIHGVTHVRLSGNLAYMSGSGLPSAGFRTTYSRDNEWGSSPQISLTVRQVYIPSLDGPSAAVAAAMVAEGGEPSGPALRTASLVVHDKVDITDRLALDYGFALQSVTFLERFNYASPFARATYDLGSGGSIRMAYSSSIQPSDLSHSAADSTVPGGAATVETGNAPELNQDLAALAQLPRISRMDGTTRVQHTQSFETSYQKVQGSRTYAVAVYRDSISDASFLLSAPVGFLPAADAMPDLGSRSMVFDTGNLQRLGYQAGVTQRAGGRLELQVTAGRGEALAGSADGSASTGDLRAMIHQVQRQWATGRASTTIAATGTRISTSYGWTDFHVLTPMHESLTGAGSQETGWNISIRQPLPGLFGVRMEATADLRNLLAQGYLPLTSGMQTAILTSAPRGIRSGLCFIF
jgi:hypothetical protein